MYDDLPEYYDTDDVQMEEIDLLTELVIAATISPDPLTAEQIDDVLGVNAAVPVREAVASARNLVASVQW